MRCCIVMVVVYCDVSPSLLRFLSLFEISASAIPKSLKTELYMNTGFGWSNFAVSMGCEKHILALEEFILGRGAESGL